MPYDGHIAVTWTCAYPGGSYRPYHIKCALIVDAIGLMSGKKK